jgi:two-component system cell cycle sensor histidine kinase/response regulator CckA
MNASSRSRSNSSRTRTVAPLSRCLNDATELKSIERQFAQSQKMQLIGQLAGGVAHDFNNLLTAISGHCDLLLLSRDAEDPDYADLSQIAQNANRAAAVVNQLLGFSRKQRLRPETLDLADTISDLTHLLGRLVGERVQLELDVDPQNPEDPGRQVPARTGADQPGGQCPRRDAAGRRADPDEARQPLSRPAARTRPRGGARGRLRLDPGDRRRHWHPGRTRSKKIFEPFFSTKGAKGTGLGLSMAYGIVKQSGGFIFVDTVEGSGTTFSLYFPVLREDRAARAVPDGASRNAAASLAMNGAGSDNEQAARLPTVADIAPRGVRVDSGARPAPGLPGASTAPAPAETVAAARATGGATSALRAETKDRPQHRANARNSGKEGGVILLVEDEAPVRAFASRALRLKGYTVLEADSAEAALATLEDASLEVDMFVSDVIMPGMDGPSWVSEALKARPGVKVVFVSGYAEDSISEHQARIPNSIFLPKPFSLTELTTTVGDQLAGR